MQAAECVTEPISNTNALFITAFSVLPSLGDSSILTLIASSAYKVFSLSQRLPIALNVINSLFFDHGAE